MNPSPIRIQLSPAIAVIFLAALTLAACELRLQIPPTSDAPDMPKYEFEATGEDYLVSALDEIHAIADWAESFTNESNRPLSNDASLSKKITLATTATDTAYIYGQVIAGGYGAVVTERYAHPKGLLLITIRKTYGKENGHVVTETKRYASHADFRSDNPQQTNVTELFGRQKDTIVTYVLRNGRLETYTFRLPVITKVVNPQDGSIRVTTRYASGGAIVSKVQDGDGNLVQLRRSYGQADGSTVTRTEYPDGSWRQVRTVGQADGTILRETTSGFQALGSGCATTISRPPIPPPIHRQMPGETTCKIDSEKESLSRTVASGLVLKPPKPPVLPPPNQRMLGGATCETIPEKEPLSHTLASGFVLRPPKPPVLPPPNQRMLGGATCETTPERIPLSRTFASGCVLRPPKIPPLPPPQQRMVSEATWVNMSERQPLSHSLASGCAIGGRPPKPPLV